MQFFQNQEVEMVQHINGKQEMVLSLTAKQQLSLLMNQESMLLTLMFGIQIPVFFQRDVKTQTLLIKL